MTAEKPHVNIEGRYSVKETCQMLEISRSTLRNHEQAGLIRRGFRKMTGRPFYAGREIIRYWSATGL